MMSAIRPRRNVSLLFILLVCAASITTVSSFHPTTTATWPSAAAARLSHRQVAFPTVTQLRTSSSVSIPEGNDAINGAGDAEQSESFLFRSATYDTLHAAMVGIVTGLSVACFKKSIDAVRIFFFERNNILNSNNLLALIPACGGLIVAALLSLGAFQPGLRGVVKKVDEASNSSRYDGLAERIRLLLDSMRKSAASAATLGTGCSLGPEGPCVEIGMSVSRSFMDTSQRRLRQQADRLEWNHRLLSCGAAAGVAAGFAAPIAGVFFALEVLQDAFDSSNSNEYAAAASVSQPVSGTARIAPILTASVFSALVANSLLGNHSPFQLANYSLQTPLLELPLYILLGFYSGGVAFMFSRMARFFQECFDGEIGGRRFGTWMKKAPRGLKPVLGGLFCGVVGCFYPQIRFFGAETQNALLGNQSLPSIVLLGSLSAKLIATSFAVASGLVGGTFAPCLFFGSMTGALFHNYVTFIFDSIPPQIAAFSGLVLADVPAYTMIGAASVLAALFRAPLTASLLLFEMTRDYDVIVPLMVSAGVGSVVGDILEKKFEHAKRPLRQKLQRATERRDTDHVSWGDLSD